ENMGVLGDFLDRITRIIDNDFLGCDEDAHRRLEPLEVERALRGFEFHQVERGEIAGGVIEKKIFAARIGGILAAGAFAGVPFMNGGIELHLGIAADVRSFSDFYHARARILSFYMSYFSI